MDNILQLKQTSAPRSVGVFKGVEKVHLNGFCDASTKDYACIHVMTFQSDSAISSSLLCAKSRIALLKTVSLSRLELSGVLLLSRLRHKIMRIISLSAGRITL